MAYIKTPQTNPERTQEDIDKEIDKWMEQYTSGIILRSHYKSEADLDADWRKYMDQYYDLKCISNNMAYRFYGMKNEEMYYKLKRYFLTHDVVEDPKNKVKVYAPKKNALMEESIASNPGADKLARDTTRSTGYYIITGGSKSIDDLNNQLYKFRSMGYDKKVKADTLSMQIYGMKNEEHYNKMMPKMLADTPVKEPLYYYDHEITYDPSLNEVCVSHPIMEDTNVTKYEVIRHNIRHSNNLNECTILLEEAMKIVPETPFEERLQEHVIDTLKTKIENLQEEDYLGFAPGLLVQEMEELGVFSGEDNCWVPGKDSTPTDWFKAYQMRSIGLKPNMVLTGSDWKYQIKNLYQGENTPIENKQKMLELGWNPAIDPNTDHAFQQASDRVNRIIRENMGYDFIDLTEATNSMPTDTIVPESNDVYGIFMIFTSSDELETLPSDVPRVLASTDPSMQALRPLNRGFFQSPITLQDLISLAKPYSVHINVYYLHFKNNIHGPLMDMLEFLKGHKSDFRFQYSILSGVINYYKSLYVANEKLFCANLYSLIIYAAQYGYQDPGVFLSMPMLANMVNTDDHKDHIYKLFGGPATNYSVEQVKNIIAYNTSNSLFENARFDYLKPYMQIIPVQEVATLPIDLDKDGNLLIRKRSKIDFPAEYSKCHQMLMQYSKAKGYEQMKYYVAKLWYMNILIEKRLHAPKKVDNVTLTKYYNTRAHILADFKKYIQEILEQDPNFDFQAYYHTTPFDRSTLKISSRLMTGIGKILKGILHPFK